MPAYKRLIAASVAAALKEENERTGKPRRVAVLSANEKSGPNKSVSTVAAAAEMVLCPLGYSGKGGVCRAGSHVSSRYVFITVSGRTRLLLYFSSQQAMNPSATATAV